MLAEAVPTAKSKEEVKMRSEERTPFSPADLCGLIAHETAELLYGVGADGIPSAEMLREGLTVFAAAVGVTDISTHLAWIDSELESAREFERTGQDTPRLLDPDRLTAMPDVSVQMEAVWEIFRTAVRLPDLRERITMRELAVTLADMGGLSDVLLGTPLPDGPRLTADALRSELAEVSTALEQRHSQSAAMEVSL